MVNKIVLSEFVIMITHIIHMAYYIPLRVVVIKFCKTTLMVKIFICNLSTYHGISCKHPIYNHGVESTPWMYNYVTLFSSKEFNLCH